MILCKVDLEMIGVMIVHRIGVIVVSVDIDLTAICSACKQYFCISETRKKEVGLQSTSKIRFKL